MSPVATWVQAIGSAGSLLGFAAYVWIMLLNRKDSDEVKREEQAQGVAAWLDTGAKHDSEADYVICVHNGGASPVFKCRSTISIPGDDQDRRTNHLHVVPPQVTAVHSFPVDVEELDEDSLYSSAAVPELEFTDSYGAHWKRDSEGVLIRLDRRRVRRGPRVKRQSEMSRAEREFRGTERPDDLSASDTSERQSTSETGEQWSRETSSESPGAADGLPIGRNGQPTS